MGNKKQEYKKCAERRLSKILESLLKEYDCKAYESEDGKEARVYIAAAASAVATAKNKIS